MKPTPTPTWVDIDAIHANPTNPRIIREPKFKQLTQSIKDAPWMLELRPIVVNSAGTVLGGNMRLQACKAAGLKQVPVVTAEGLTAEQEREFIIKDNVGFGEWDWELLANEWDATELQEWGLDLPEIKIDSGEAEDDNYVTPPAWQPDIKPGDLFVIGTHRLLCGDSTDPEYMRQLMDGIKADMVFTDPPYGVNVKGGKSKNNTIAGDLTQTAIPFAFELAIKNTKEEARFYFCGASSNISLYFKLCERYLSKMPGIIIWDKGSFVLKQNGYHAQYELVFYTYKDGGGGMKHWYSTREGKDASDVWSIRRDATSSYMHPTQKPIEIPARAIRNSSQAGQIVLEPFSGSGSTMAACHQLQRHCYAMELDPFFTWVTIDRMLKLDPSLTITKNGKPYTHEQEVKP